MRVAVAIDSLKGSLSTFEAGAAVREGILRVYPEAEVVISPLADGGEGTVAAIVAAQGGVMQRVAAHDPLGRPIQCEYGILPSQETAVIEMSCAAGITLLEAAERNPMQTTTYGVGEVIADAIARGCRRFILGIGGSATNDGGVGMLQALGFSFLDANGAEIPRGAAGLASLANICTDSALPALKECSFLVACDVKNPLCGKNGCSAVYGPQKGATPEMIEQMDGWLANYAAVTKKALPHADAEYEGAGAAGGMGFALLSYLNARLQSGIALVMEAVGLESVVACADIVVTGEGRLDAQSCMGKAPVGVASLAKQFGKPVIAFSGCIGRGAETCNSCGIDAYFPILPCPCTLDEAMNCKNAYQNLANTAEQAFRLIRACGKDSVAFKG